MDKSWKPIYESLQTESHRFQERWTIWKSNLYNTFLIANTLFVAICIPVINEGAVEKVLCSVVIISAMLSMAGIVLIISSTIKMYDRLGFRPTPRDEDSLNKEYVYQLHLFHETEKLRKKRRWIDRAVFVLFWTNLAVLIALIFKNCFPI